MADLQLQPQLEYARDGLHPGVRFLLYHGFVSGVVKPPDTIFHSIHLKGLVDRGLAVVHPSGEYELTLAGIDTYTQHYLRQVADDIITEKTVVNYFRCQYSPRIDGRFEGPAIVCSNEGVINYTKLLLTTEHLSLSPRTAMCDYAVLDFIDQYTGESHDLYPGDTVVMNGDGYVIHKFSE